MLWLNEKRLKEKNSLLRKNILFFYNKKKQKHFFLYMNVFLNFNYQGISNVKIKKHILKF